MRIKAGLREVFYPNLPSCRIMQILIERAFGYSQTAYADPRSALRAGYEGIGQGDPVYPAIITGLAGCGKSKLCEALERILSGRTHVFIDEGHPSVPLNDFELLKVGSRRSISQILRTLGPPGMLAGGTNRIKEADVPLECGSWSGFCGLCLYGLEELQFMTQSEGATALISKLLLSCSEVRIPWFVVANYSFIWKLMNEKHGKSEIKQRFLDDQLLLLPDPESSDDWKELLREYQVVLGAVLAFELEAASLELWNWSAGLKRELVKLLAEAYRVARERGAFVVELQDVQEAYGSARFTAARGDIELLCAHAGQGGDLRLDLQCPLKSLSIDSVVDEEYQDELRRVREKAVALAVIKAAATANEKRAISSLESPRTSAAMSPNAAGKRRRKTTAELQETGRRAKAARARGKQKPKEPKPGVDESI
ncbi:hypothetical protein [Variovorax sp. Sphag1AA]|uniref:hypothetical protein n=1 Tax=Variovorax sp. Sphag1AA TaxID=2587027 RepID=UPI001618081F|nr:hypothetical protein [Variovorax sp. Sphag1AA]MBB3181170.1 energy-coupling factor transporter ATP-binding protein EcfA2 [Variovorax sp. Sphag1AA]